MALSRAKRRIDFTRSMVPEAVGPGTYNPTSKWTLKHSQAPFGSTSGREGNERSADMPGPGQYSGDIVKNSSVNSGLTPNKDGIVKNSCMFASRSSRMAYEQTLLRQSSNLGPGSYDVSDVSWIKSASARRASSPTASTSALGSLKGPAALTWSKVSTAPSIPAANQSYGYEEGPSGELVQQRPLVDKTSMPSGGPAHYDPNFKLVKTKVPNVPSFSGSKVPRLTNPNKFAIECPGPGAYDVAHPTWVGEQELRPSHIFLSSTNRGKLSEDKKGLPGPGAYDVTTTWPMAKPKPLADTAISATGLGLLGSEDMFQAFGRTTHKDPNATSGGGGGGGTSQPTSQPAHGSSATAADHLPGPGAYNLPSSVFEAIPKKKNRRTRTGEVLRNGFGSSDRFPDTGNVTSAYTPGPGYYSSEKDLLASKMRHQAVGRYGVFGTTSQRFPPSKPMVDDSVGPGTYNAPALKSPSELRRKDARSAVFLSKTSRSAAGETTTHKPDEGPCVGSYNPPASPWVKKQSQTAAHFMGQAPRFREKVLTVTPGPGYYDPTLHTIETSALGANLAVIKGEVRRTTHKGINRSGSKIHLTSVAPRFKEAKDKDKLPGPGTYDYDDNYSFVKKTYNITIGDSW